MIIVDHTNSFEDSVHANSTVDMYSEYIIYRVAASVSDTRTIVPGNWYCTYKGYVVPEYCATDRWRIVYGTLQKCTVRCSPGHISCYVVRVVVALPLELLSGHQPINIFMYMCTSQIVDSGHAYALTTVVCSYADRLLIG
jgi:hypothetical protein